MPRDVVVAGSPDSGPRGFVAFLDKNGSISMRFSARGQAIFDARARHWTAGPGSNKEGEVRRISRLFAATATVLALSVLTIPAGGQEPGGEEEDDVECCRAVFGAECCGTNGCGAGLFQCHANP